MSMVVKNNMSAVSVLNTLNKNSSALGKNLEHVATGMKLNSAADDNSGYAISERMRVQIRSLDQANQNTQNGSSMMKVAEGAVSSTIDLLKTLKEKVINAANDTNTDSDRQTIQKELDQSIDQINDNANITFNGKYLIDGSKNEIGKATYTTLTNQNLATDTSGATPLTELKNRQGEKLGILTTDRVSVSYVQQGKTYSTTFDVTASMSLAKVLKNAETVDPTGYTFGTQSNESIARINGISDPAVLRQKETDANTYVNDALAAMNNAASWYNNYTSAVSAANTARANLATAVNALSGLSSGATSLLGSSATAISQYTTWDSGGTSAYTAYDGSNRDPSALLVNPFGAMYTAGGTASSSSADGVILINLKSAYDTYKTAFDALDAYKVNRGTSQDLTGSAALQATPAATLTDLTPGTYTMTDYGTYLSSATNVYNTAVAYQDSLSGPAILNGTEVGVGKNNEVVSTVNQENGVTITAYSSGVNGQISGLTISVMDSDGKIKQSVNAVLDAFSETIRAENASDDNAMVIQVGTKANQAIKLGLSDMRAEALGLKGSDGTTLNISTQTKANAAINVLDNAIQKALDQQVKIGATNYRFEFTSKNLNTASENVQASESTYRDADMAREMADYTKNNVLLQASQAMLAQANQNSSDVLMLLR